MKHPETVKVVILALALGSGTLEATPSPPTQDWVLRFGPADNGEGNHGVVWDASPIYDAGGDLTVELWVYPEDLPGCPNGDPEYSRILIRQGEFPEGYWRYLLRRSVDSFCLFQSTGEMNDDSVEVCSDNIFPSGQWYHLAAVVAGSQLTLFVDGSEAATTPSPGPLFDGPSDFFGVADAGCEGIAQLRLWARALAPEELGSPIQGSEPDLLGSFPFDDRPETSVMRDESTVGNDLPFDSTLAQRTLPNRISRQALEGGPYYIPTEYPAAGQHVRGALIDYDDDGVLDYLRIVAPLREDLTPGWPYWTPPAPSPAQVFRNDGTGTFTEVTAQVMIPAEIQFTGARRVAVADFTGDEREDVFVADHGFEFFELGPSCCEGELDRMLIQTPDGHLADDGSTRIPQPGVTFTHALAAGDIDGDGDIDLFVGTSNENANPDSCIEKELPPDTVCSALYVNDGSGFFEAIRAPNLPDFTLFYQGWSTHVGFVDVDSDGDLDLLGSAEPFFTGVDEDYVLLNNGLGSFTYAPGLTPPLPTGVSGGIVAGADLDGDSWNDLVWARCHECSPTPGNPDGRRLALFKNTGNGAFADQSWRIPDIADLRFRDADRIVIQDLNGDGYPEILAGPLGRPVVLWNGGGGSFGVDPGVIGLGGGEAYFLVGNLDADPGMDLLVEGETWFSVHLNVAPYFLTVPPPMIFADGFESGDTSAW